MFGWVALQGDFRGVGIKYKGKHMKGCQWRSRRGLSAFRKALLGKAGGVALPRGPVQTSGSEACASRSRPFAHFAHMCISVAFSVPA